MWPASSNGLGLVQRRRARAEQTFHMALQLCLQRLALFLVSPVLHDAAGNKKSFEVCESRMLSHHGVKYNHEKCLQD